MDTDVMLRFGDKLNAGLRRVVSLDEQRMAAHQIAMTLIVEAYRRGRADERAASQQRLPLGQP